MPLSEHEQRLLEQIERALYAEDPKFASTVRGGRMRKPTRRRRVQGIALLLLGVVMLVTGIVTTSLNQSNLFLVISAVGFLLMLGGAVLAVTSVGRSGTQSEPAADADADKNRFTGRMEERFRRRFEQE